ncbi:nickel/cobalt transporter [Salmonella enterica]|uniref:Nickel/cobalt efflux system n=3 Tax=Salmonella enterica TaxID=28901 RepID=A0A5Z3DHW6_SALER|nr:nickel/cobalt transporter [Salmonella enterica]EAA7302318.1 nickel/cobalt transporter [Salmonella enterica subsp. arizonae]EAA7638466.1 nickel/cobalt transporter [Salmonella enterica subsp. enterica]ECT7523412.1 nickel/cobalt transporter [Salmonella enterica subsp. enterica serovar Anatum]EDW4327606.1 nickel/cobalt transporter [Salmonella enterica subsp. enterica serovar Cerro]EAM3021377.1 nickel/cobalt transporter [Salmonella enterica]
MSVIFSQRAPGRRWLSLWPLALFLLLMLVGGLWIWQAWPQVMLKSALWQRDVNQQLSALLNAVATHPERAGGSLLLLSFMYGVLHALGPGHGKVVIATWLATHPSKLKSGIVLTLAAALLQGFVAIGLVVGVLTVLQLPARQLHLSGFWLEKGSYALVGGLGILLCWRAIKRLRALLRKPVFIAFTPRHVHHEKCGCGHQHLPTQEQLHSGDDWRARLMIVLSMGMRPCSGAIMVLLFSKVIGVFSWGMASVLAMAAGTSLTITSLALLVHTFRALAVKLSGNKAPALWRQVGWSTLALAGGVILLVAALVMWFSVPQPVGGLRPWRG